MTVFSTAWAALPFAVIGMVLVIHGIYRAGADRAAARQQKEDRRAIQQSIHIRDRLRRDRVYARRVRDRFSR